MAATITQAHVYQRHTRRSEGDRVIHPLPLSFSPLTHHRRLQDCKLQHKQTDASRLRANFQREGVCFLLLRIKHRNCCERPFHWFFQVQVNIDRPGYSFSWSTVQHLPMDKMTKRKSGDQGMSAYQNQRQTERLGLSLLWCAQNFESTYHGFLTFSAQFKGKLSCSQIGWFTRHETSCQDESQDGR